MDERGLKYFEVVVQSGSIRGASDLLHIAPSAISRQIRELESVLDIKLIDRLGRRGVASTEAGDLLLGYIKKLRLRENNLFAEISDLNRLRTGTLRIASGGGFIGDFITNVLKKFSEQYPGIRFTFSGCAGDEVLRQVRDDRADVGLLLSFPTTQSTIRVPQIKTLLSNELQPLSLIVNSKSPIAKLQSIGFPQLKNIRLALLSESFIISHLVRTFEAQHHIRLSPVITCDSFEAITACLLLNLGAAILPVYCVAGEIAKGTVTTVPITDVLHNRLSVDLVVNRKRAEANSVVAFCDCVNENMLAFKLPKAQGI